MHLELFRFFFFYNFELLPGGQKTSGKFVAWTDFGSKLAENQATEQSSQVGKENSLSDKFQLRLDIGGQ